MIFITIHNNPNNISNEKDITLCLPFFELENIDSLSKIIFELDSSDYSLHFLSNSNGKFQVNYIGSNIDKIFSDFSKASKFEIVRKDGFNPKREFLVNDYNEIDKIMVIGGRWIRE